MTLSEGHGLCAVFGILAKHRRLGIPLSILVNCFYQLVAPAALVRHHFGDMKNEMLNEEG